MPLAARSRSISKALGGLFAVSLAAGALAWGAAPASAEGSSPGCSLFASNSGSDSASGTSSAPLKTIGALARHLQAGQVGCLAAGQSFNESLTLRGGETHGSEGAPVTITSSDPENPALINGRIVTEPGADWLTFTHLHFTYTENGLPSLTVGSKHTTWTYDDVTAPKTICFNLINSSWGLAEYTLIEHDRVHGCGSQEHFVCNENTAYCSTPPNDGFFIHGIYVGGAKETTIRNNYIYENADRAVQVRSGSSGVIIEHNIMDRNGEGVIFGDGATHTTVQWNIITNSHSPCGEIAGCYDYGASEYAAGTGNTLANNDAYGNQCATSAPACYPNRGNIETMAHVTTEHNLETNPLYTNPTEHNYTLPTTSPTLGYGPDTAQPNTTPPPETPRESPKPPPVEVPRESPPPTPVEAPHKAPESPQPAGPEGLAAGTPPAPVLAPAPVAAAPTAPAGSQQSAPTGSTTGSPRGHRRSHRRLHRRVTRSLRLLARHKHR